MPSNNSKYTQEMREIFYYIEMIYNRKRLHSTLGYMSPVAYRLLYLKADIA